jgi:hypothetical protein
MKSEESILTDFNLYFVTFPRQTFVKIIDSKMPLDTAKELTHQSLLATFTSCSPNPMV